MQWLKNQCPKSGIYSHYGIFSLHVPNLVEILDLPVKGSSALPHVPSSLAKGAGERLSAL